MRRLYIHFMAFIVIAIATMISSCEGPGTIEQNVYLEDTLIKTVYDTIYTEKIKEVYIYETDYVEPDTFYVKDDEGPFTGGVAYDTLYLVYSDTTFTRTMRRNLIYVPDSTKPDTITVTDIYIDQESIRIVKETNNTSIATFDIIVTFSDGTSRTYPQEITFVTGNGADVVTIGTNYRISTAEVTVLWQESGLERLDSVKGVTHYKRRFLSQLAYNLNDTLFLEQKWVEGQGNGEIITYSIEGNFEMQIDTVFPSAYTIAGQNSLYTSSYLSPLILNSFLFDTKTAKPQGRIPQTELGGYAQSLYYFLNSNQDEISNKASIYNQITNSVYMNVGPSVGGVLPETFELLINFTISGNFDSSFGPTEERLDVTIWIEFTK
jgi:hypothetical protein